MKKMTLRAAGLAVCAALLLNLAACGGSSSAAESASSGEAEAEVLTFGDYTEYSYTDFDETDGMGDDGYWEGVTALDYVTLPEDFAAITIPADRVTPTEADIDEQVESLLSGFATMEEITGRPAQLGDTANIDYVGTVDGVAFTGGTAQGFDLELGSGTFLGAGNGYKGFEEQLVGHSAGETFDIEVWFPDGYGDSTDADGNTVSLNGKAAVFAITLNKLTTTVTPELTDDWVYQNLAETHYVGTVAQLRDSIRDQLLDANRKSYLYNYLMENSTFAEPPESLLRYEVTYCLNYFYTYAQYYGMEFEEFVTSMLGTESINQLLEDEAGTIYDICHEELLYQAVAEALGLVLDDEAMAPYEEYKGSYPENYIRHSALIDLSMEALNKGATAA